MFEILGRENLAPNVVLYEVHAPRVAHRYRPGQFVMVRPTAHSERIPLSVADSSLEKQSITFVVKAVGKTTREMVDGFTKGGSFHNIAGPLGMPTRIALPGRPEDERGTVVCIAGGIGASPILPIARAFQSRGHEVITILGAGSAEQLILVDRLDSASERLLLCTLDGSVGRKGPVTSILTDFLREQRAHGEEVHLALAAGPPEMMRLCAEATLPFHIPTLVSLHTVMLDGTGMCGGCRVQVGGDVKYVCVDGPEFDGHKVDFDTLARRQAMYRAEEQEALSFHDGSHRCLAREAAEVLENPPRAKDALQYSADQARSEAVRCLGQVTSPCTAACPVGVDVPGFLKMVAEGDFRAAIRTIKETNLLPAIAGRICPQEDHCQKDCAVAELHEDPGYAVSVGRIEAFLADWERIEGGVEIPLAGNPTGLHVAVIGSGPAGLTCAGELKRYGHDVTVFEAFHKAGGVLVYGIPEFRLPREVVEAEIENLVRMGVVFEFDIVIGQTLAVEDLLDEGYDAVFLATGAGLPHLVDIPGETLNGVYAASEYLTRVNLMNGRQFPREDTPVLRRDHVAVLGGGNAALDAARTALRLGAKRVHLIYRRSRDEMPARKEEIAHAEEDGVEFRFLSAPIEIIGTPDGWVRGLKIRRCLPVDPDEKGRRRSVPIEGAIEELEVELLIEAIGNGPNLLIPRMTTGLRTTRQGTLVVDDRTLMTTRKGVFAGGDIVDRSSTVILAMGQGRQAASAIDSYLRAEAVPRGR